MPDTPEVYYSVNVIDGDEPIPAMDLPGTIWTPGLQDSGRCRWSVEVPSGKVAQFEAMLDADPTVLEYYDTATD